MARRVAGASDNANERELVQNRLLTSYPAAFQYWVMFRMHISAVSCNVLFGFIQVLIPSGGLSMGDLRLQLFGKFVVTALDEKGRGLIPLRGRPSWSEER